MRSTVRLVFLSMCVMNAALSSSFESEDVVPVRINSRTNGRFWKRSGEEQRFVIHAFGKDMTLNLVPDTSFIAPSFSIQRLSSRDAGALRSASGDNDAPEPELQMSPSRTEDSEGQLRSCFYSGTVDYDRNSVVAVSLCSGISGAFITKGNDYLIEPKHGASSGPDNTEHLHVIKRRTVAKGHGVSVLFNRTAEERGAEKGDGETFTHSDSDARGQPRRRRFVSAPRFIETLVVADSTMTHFYGDEIKVRYNELIPSCTHS